MKLIAIFDQRPGACALLFQIRTVKPRPGLCSGPEFERQFAGVPGIKAAREASRDPVIERNFSIEYTPARYD